MRDYIDLFNEHDDKLEAEAQAYAEEAPRCCCCSKAILDEDALCVDGRWYCDDKSCVHEFYMDMEAKYRKSIA